MDFLFIFIYLYIYYNLQNYNKLYVKATSINGYRPNGFLKQNKIPILYNSFRHYEGIRSFFVAVVGEKIKLVYANEIYSLGIFTSANCILKSQGYLWSFI